MDEAMAMGMDFSLDEASVVCMTSLHERAYGSHGARFSLTLRVSVTDHGWFSLASCTAWLVGALRVSSQLGGAFSSCR